MILVTGATGLVGSQLVFYLLQKGDNVRAIYRNAESLEQTKIFLNTLGSTPLQKLEWICADITETPSLEKAFHGIDSVYHCAAMISFDPADETKLRKTNIEGTANIVNFCLAKGVKKLCYVSSIAALGDLKEDQRNNPNILVTEETEWNPEMEHTDYAISKYGAEMEVWRGWQEGLQVCIINPGVILGYGPKHSGSIEIFSKIRNKLPFYTKGVTGFVAVEDVIEILYRLMKSDISGERFIVISEMASFEQLLQKIAKALQVKPPGFYAKPWLTSIGWRFDWLLSLFGKKRQLSQAMAHASHNRTYYSNEKIRAALELDFENLEKTIFKTALQFEKN